MIAKNKARDQTVKDNDFSVVLRGLTSRASTIKLPGRRRCSSDKKAAEKGAGRRERKATKTLAVVLGACATLHYPKLQGARAVLTNGHTGYVPRALGFFFFLRAPNWLW